MKQKVHKRVDEAFEAWAEMPPDTVSYQILRHAFRAGWEAHRRFQLAAAVATVQRRLLATGRRKPK